MHGMLGLPRLAVVIILVVAALAACAPSPAAAAKPASGVFVGRSGSIAFAVVLDARAVTAYVCDGKRLGSWYDRARPAGSTITLGKGTAKLTLTVSATKVDATLGATRATLARARGNQGLFRADRRRSGVRSQAGWVVLPGGRQIGSVTSTTIKPAPVLSTTTLAAGSFVVGRVLAPLSSSQLVVADVAGDGILLDRSVTTTLAGSPAHSVTWTRAGDDDAFLAIDTAALKAAGYNLTLVEGGAVPATVLVRGGLTITRLGTANTTVDGFDTFKALDANGDGFVDPRDPAFRALRLYTDRNADGEVSQDELDSLSEISGEQALRLQTLMERLAAAQQVESSILKKLSGTTVAIVGNLK